jgi:O-antigen ligase
MGKSSMQITDNFSNTAFPPSKGGNALDIASQLSHQQASHRRILRARALQFWWYRVLFVVLAVVVAVILGEVSTLLPSPTYALAFFGAFMAIPIVVWTVRRVEFGMILLVVGSTAFFGKLITLKALVVYPMIPLLLLLFCALLVMVTFHVRTPVLPSFWVIWPQIVLIVLAFASTIMVQLTWTHGVPHKINGNPIIYDEILGVGTFFLPLMTFLVTTTVVTGRERLIQTIQNILLVVAIMAAVVVIIDFRRIGGDIYSFRFNEPHIAWMSLRALAQILALGSMLAYARFLYASGWHGPIRIPELSFLRGSIRIRERVFFSKVDLSYGWVRVIFGVITVMCLGAVMVTLQNSWWVELGVALALMTVMYSRRLTAFFVVVLIPFLPVIKSVIAHIQTVKTDDYTRIYIWQDALSVWSKQRLLGVGPGDFWAYDQVFTNLPRALRNFNVTGLGVAHNGYLQVLAELGPLGLFCWVVFPIFVIVAAVRLYRRTNAGMPRIRRKGSVLNMIDLGLFADSDPEKRNDCMLALVCIGLAAGSLCGDFTSGGFFLPPRQISALNDVPQLVSSWVIWALVMYKDQLWRKARRAAKLKGQSL